jgi:hypothetical protein
MESLVPAASVRSDWTSRCLNLKDNRGINGDHGAPRLPSLLAAETSNPELNQGIYDLLARFSGKTPADYEKKGVELIPVARVPAGEQESDGSESLPVFVMHGDTFDSARIETGNCMGVVKLTDESSRVEIQLSIGSRFDKSDRQYFLTHLLGKVFGGSFVDLVDAGPDSYWKILLAILFRNRLIEDSRIGLFRQYRQVPHHDLRFRGKLDMAAFIRRDIPFVGRLSYETHDITLDNHLNHLVRHACNRLSGEWRKFLFGDKSLTDYYHELERETPTWQKRNSLDCMAKNQRPVKHPYFHSTYEPLRKLALRILRNEGITPYSETDEVEGVLFDGSWLWEEYLWTLLKPLGFEHPRNKAQTGAWKVLQQSFYPDYYLLKDGCPRIVLDAKYKSERIDQRDILHVSGYMHILEARIGGLIKPIRDSAHEEFSWDLVRDHKSSWHVLGLDIPENAANAREYFQAIRSSEQRLSNEINRLGGCI